MKTFTLFMDTVRKDLKQKIEKMEKVEEEKRKANDVRVIKCERDFFRLEAIRLNNLCKEISTHNDEITLKLKTLSSELANVTKKWKDSENINKQLLVELERNVQLNNQMKEEANVNKIQTLPELTNEMRSETALDLDDKEGVMRKDKLVLIVEKLKRELKKERARNHQILGEFNKIMIDKNKLEKIFIDCVEETRKEIYNRKIRDTVNKDNLKKKASNTNQNLKIPYISDVKYEHFLSSDKKKLIETFILKEEVINLVKDYIFKNKEDYFNSNSPIHSEKNDFAQTRTSFMRTDNKLFSMTTFRKKTPSTAFSFPVHINR